MAGNFRRDCLGRIDQLSIVLHQGQPIAHGAWQEVNGVISGLRLIVYHAAGDRCGDLSLP